MTKSNIHTSGYYFPASPTAEADDKVILFRDKNNAWKWSNALIRERAKLAKENPDATLDDLEVHLKEQFGLEVIPDGAFSSGTHWAGLRITNPAAYTMFLLGQTDD